MWDNCIVLIIAFLSIFYVAWLPCPTVSLTGKNEFLILQRYAYFLSECSAAGLLSGLLTAKVLQWHSKKLLHHVLVEQYLLEKYSYPEFIYMVLYIKYKVQSSTLLPTQL